MAGEEWQEKVYDREEWKKLLRTARHSAHANGMNENTASEHCTFSWHLPHVSAVLAVTSYDFTATLISERFST